MIASDIALRLEGRRCAHRIAVCPRSASTARRMPFTTSVQASSRFYQLVTGLPSLGSAWSLAKRRAVPVGLPKEETGMTRAWPASWRSRARRILLVEAVVGREEVGADEEEGSRRPRRSACRSGQPTRPRRRCGDHGSDRRALAFEKNEVGLQLRRGGELILVGVAEEEAEGASLAEQFSLEMSRP